MIRKTLLLLFLGISISIAEANIVKPKKLLSKKQKEVLHKVREVAKTIPDKYGETYEDTMSAICITESSAGKNIVGDLKDGEPITEGSLGILQVRIKTVRWLSRVVPELNYIKRYSDEQLAQKLLNNITFSAKVATHYFVRNKNATSYKVAISRYNGGNENWKYINKVFKSMKLVRKAKKSGEIKL